MVGLIKTSRSAQLALLMLLWLAGCAVARLTGSALPGGLLGLFALLGLLGSGVLDPSLLARGAHWLLAHMLLFFVPAVVGLMGHPEFFGTLGLKVLVVILGSTLMVMLATAFTVEFSVRLRAHHVRTTAAVE